MQAALRRYSEEVRRTHGLAVHFRIGLNSGEVVVRGIDNDLHMDYSAIGHLSRGLDVLKTLPDAPACAQQELGFLTTLGLAIVATKGQAHAEAERTYLRARSLCQQLEETSQLFRVLWGLLSFYVVRADLQATWEVGDELLDLAQHAHDPARLMVAHWALGQTLLFRGELALALDYAAMLYQFRRDRRRAQESAKTAMTLCTEQRFAYYLAWETIMQGWALAAQQQGEEGMAQMRHALDAIKATGAELRQPYYRGLLAEACGTVGQVEDGLTMLADALAEVHRTGERWWEVELHRVK